MENGGQRRPSLNRRAGTTSQIPEGQPLPLTGTLPDACIQDALAEFTFHQTYMKSTPTKNERKILIATFTLALEALSTGLAGCCCDAIRAATSGFCWQTDYGPRKLCLKYFEALFKPEDVHPGGFWWPRPPVFGGGSTRSGLPSYEQRLLAFMLAIESLKT